MLQASDQGDMQAVMLIAYVATLGRDLLQSFNLAGGQVGDPRPAGRHHEAMPECTWPVYCSGVIADIGFRVARIRDILGPHAERYIHGYAGVDGVSLVQHCCC